MSAFNPHFTQWHSFSTDKSAEEFTVQTEEVTEVRWFTADEVRTMVKKRPEAFVNNIFDWIALFLAE